MNKCPHCNKVNSIQKKELVSIPFERYWSIQLPELETDELIKSEEIDTVLLIEESYICVECNNQVVWDEKQSTFNKIS